MNLSLSFLFFWGEVGLKLITGAMGKSRAEIQGIYTDRTYCMGT